MSEASSLTHSIALTFPDGSVRAFAKGSTVRDVARSISDTVFKRSVAADVNGEIVSLETRVEQDSHITLLTVHDPEALPVIRHSCAQLLGQAIAARFPQAEQVDTVLTEQGFYCDIESETPLTTVDLAHLESDMTQLIKAGAPISVEIVTARDAVACFAAKRAPRLVQTLRQYDPDQPVSLWRHQDYRHLLSAPPAPSTQFLRHFALLSVAGAYLNGDASNIQLQRIHVAVWATAKQLTGWLEQRAEAELRDHRKLGRELDLFHFQEEAPGAVFWHPRGWTIFQTLIGFMRQRHQEAGYVEVNTPDVMDRALWEVSGHWENYRDHMFTTQTEEGRVFALKPMNCPGAVALFTHRLKSYRELPVRMSEFGKVHRYEPSGSLHGLLRVRHFTQDDAHIFCTEAQVESECRQILRLVLDIYQQFGFTDVEIKLSTRPEKRIGSDADWDHLENALKASLAAEGLDWQENPGEGAFYGPKLEFVLRDALGRDWQCGTLQVDMNLPERFNMRYVNEVGATARPVMLHRALFGSLERFTGILLEHYAGKLPAWLSPVQAVVMTVSGHQTHYAQEIAATLRRRGIRTECDTRNEKIGLKIRENTLSRVPFMLIVGEKEQGENRVTIRDRSGAGMGTLLLDEAVDALLLCCQMPQNLATKDN